MPWLERRRWDGLGPVCLRRCRTAGSHSRWPSSWSCCFTFLDNTVVAGIAQRGLEPAKRETYSDGVRKMTYIDPDGNENGFGGLPR